MVLYDPFDLDRIDRGREGPDDELDGVTTKVDAIDRRRDEVADIGGAPLWSRGL